MEDEGAEYRQTELARRNIKLDEIREIGRGLVVQPFKEIREIGRGLVVQPSKEIREIGRGLVVQPFKEIREIGRGLVVQPFKGKNNNFVLKAGFDRKPV